MSARLRTGARFPPAATSPALSTRRRMNFNGAMPKPKRAKTAGDDRASRVLIVWSEPLEQILRGSKTWEIRSRRVKLRGRIALIESGSGTGGWHLRAGRLHRSAQPGATPHRCPPGRLPSGDGIPCGDLRLGAEGRAPSAAALAIRPSARGDHPVRLSPVRATAASRGQVGAPGQGPGAEAVARARTGRPRCRAGASNRAFLARPSTSRQRGLTDICPRRSSRVGRPYGPARSACDTRRPFCVPLTAAGTSGTLGPAKTALGSGPQRTALKSTSARELQPAKGPRAS